MLLLRGDIKTARLQTQTLLLLAVAVIQVELHCGLEGHSLGQQTLDQGRVEACSFEQIDNLVLLSLHVAGNVLINNEDFGLTLPHIVKHLVLV